MKKVLCFFIPFLLTGLVLGIIISLLHASGSVLAAPAVGNIIVDTLVDEQDSDGNCSLREAIMAANTNQPVDACPAGNVLTDTIIFDVEGTITVTHQLSVTASGPLVIDGGGVITTSGGGTTRIWWVEANSALTLQNMAITDGYVIDDDGAGIYNHAGNLAIIHSRLVNNHFIISHLSGYGGAIYSEGGVLYVHDSNFDDNGSDDRFSSGGGIAAINTNGQITGSIFKKNHSIGCLQGIPCTSYAGGGGLYLQYSIFSIQDSTFISNTTEAGGGINNYFSSINISGSTFSGNTSEVGGGIYNIGLVQVNSSTFTDNHGNREGGSILNASTMTITHGTFSNNSSLTGGALVNYHILSITDSSFINNSSMSGGAIRNDVYQGDRLIIFGSTFYGNSAQYFGGAIYTHPREPSIPPHTVMIVNTTVNGNSAGDRGGGLYDDGSNIILKNSTISENSASSGGGIYIWPQYSITTPVTLTNTIVSNSLLGGDCVGNDQIVDGGHNLDSDGSCQLDPAVGSLPNTNPRLGPLQDNGGPTWTQALLWGSPAIDAGNNVTCPPADQRGVPRPLDGNGDGIAVCDIGAFEVDNPLIPNRVYMPFILRN